MPHKSFLLGTIAVSALALLAVSVDAQTIDDGVMVDRGEVRAGNQFTFDTWSEYWEGALKRRNDNIGTISTRVNTWIANYGVSGRVNVIAAVPYVWTHADQGVLHGIQGFQDVTLAAKYRLVQRSAGSGVLRVFTVVSAGIPMTNYNLELLPLSIGIGSTRLSWRGTVNHRAAGGWFVNGSNAYTWRSDVHLDRPYFFTDDTFVMGDRVDVPNVYDYIASSGYMGEGLMLAGFVSQQWTLGGGDIRRQDMPFVSNRMNTTQAGAMSMWPLPRISSVIVQLSAAHTLTGRNVGNASTFSAGLMYRFNRRAR